jgi:energy-coupling factor transporter transmembrane protein EcfT
MPVPLILIILFILVVFFLCAIIERKDGASFCLIMSLMIFGFWFLISLNQNTLIHKETIYPVQEIDYDKGKIQVIIREGDITPLSTKFNYYLDAEKFDVKVVEYKKNYVGIWYPIRDTYEVVEKNGK